MAASANLGSGLGPGASMKASYSSGSGKLGFLASIVGMGSSPTPASSGSVARHSHPALDLFTAVGLR
jgi:hypothetical protein